MRVYFVLGAIIGLIFSASLPAHAAHPDIKEQTKLFLDAYARGDHDKILPMLDPGVVIYGSDEDEFFVGTDAAMTLLAEDQRLWGGPAKIGEMKQVTVVQQASLASIFFHASFSAGGRAPITVRFSMVWKLAQGHWLLMQSSNAVPTHGQSAAQLLKSK